METTNEARNEARFVCCRSLSATIVVLNHYSHAYTHYYIQLRTLADVLSYDNTTLYIKLTENISFLVF